MFLAASRQATGTRQRRGSLGYYNQSTQPVLLAYERSQAWSGPFAPLSLSLSLTQRCVLNAGLTAAGVFSVQCRVVRARVPALPSTHTHTHAHTHSHTVEVSLSSSSNPTPSLSLSLSLSLQLALPSLRLRRFVPNTTMEREWVSGVLTFISLL